MFSTITAKPVRLTGRQLLMIAAIMALGALLSLAGFLLTQSAEDARAQSSFELGAIQGINSLKGSIIGTLNSLQALSAFHDATGNFNRSSFHRFVTSLLAHDSRIQALEWAPRVPASRREALEKMAQRDGFPDFHFIERDAAGHMRTEGQRDEYFPVYYVEPLAGNEPAVGFDLASSKPRKDAIEAAIDGGKMLATQRIILVQETSNQYGFLVFLPVYASNVPLHTVAERRASVLGLMLGVYRVGEIVNRSLANAKGYTQQFNLVIYDKSAPPREQLLFPKNYESESAGSNVSGIKVVQEFEVAGRKWQVVVTPTKEFMQSTRQYISWMVFGASLLVSVLLSIIVGVIFAKRNRIHEIEGHLAHAQKMETVGKMTGGLAHDFNNLLLIIIGNVDFLEGAVADNPGAEESVQAIIDASLRGAELTRALLAFSRRQSLSPKLFDVNELIDKTSRMLTRTLGANIRIELQLGTQTWPLYLDDTQLEATLVNIAINSRDAMPTGGVLSIATKNMHLDAERVDGSAVIPKGDYVTIKFSDTGTGIPAQVIGHIFEPFFTTKPRSKGTGLGLSMVYGYVKQSGGYVTAASAIGKGTEIRLYLPRAVKSELPQARQIKETGQSTCSRNEVILAVDDDADVRATVARQLRELGYQVLEADAALAALAILEKAERVDLLFTDIVMPGSLNGKELADMARKKQPGLKVLLTSGFAENGGGDDNQLDLSNELCLAKPYRKNDLAKAVREALELQMAA